MILLLFGVSFIVFMSMHLAPGDPATIVAGPGATSTDLEAIRADMGLDKPVIIQYFDNLQGSVQGDFGYSYQTEESVIHAIIRRFSNIFKLSFVSMIVATIIGVVAGVISAITQNTCLDFASTT